jgi:hypothetical protein
LAANRHHLGAYFVLALGPWATRAMAMKADEIALLVLGLALICLVAWAIFG